MDTRAIGGCPLVSARIYVEGGGNRNSDRVRCREGFSRLFEKAGLKDRMPRFVACGPRNAAYDDFKTAHSTAYSGDFIGLLVDSEDPVTDIEKPWEHVSRRADDNWARPDGADDEQLMLMTTSMETWIVTDREALKSHFGPRLIESALPPIQNIEQRNRHAILNALQNASRDCPGPYSKGPKSFELLGKISPHVLEQHLPSFGRTRRILNSKL